MRNEVACDNAAARRSAAPEAPLREVLARYWGYEDFLPLQREAMASVLAGRDSLVVLPTGGGKSLCFQAPALLMDGTAVVVSPLISLMKDQVDALAANGVPAGCLHSAQAPEEHHEVVARARRGELKLLYAAPERLVMPSFLEFLAAARVAFFAIDEAHCISHWGHDFRPEYRALRLLKERFPRAGVHAYTATATPRVRDDIVSELALRDPSVLVGTFDRPNLLYRVRPRERGAARFAQLEEALARHRAHDADREARAGERVAHDIAVGRPRSAPTARTSSLNSARSGSTRENCRSSGRPPTLWWLLMFAVPVPPPDSTTSG